MRERKRLITQYGYTDSTIMDCLDYLYNVLKMKVLSKSLCLVTPTNIERMKKYKREQAMAAGYIIAAANTPIIERKVAITENIDEPRNDEEDLEEWFED